jgi:cellulose synthase/poly-beta-1,6-N-acetylglucosamine synthase-like glycosyltransferase
MQVKLSETINARYVLLYTLLATLYMLAILLPVRWFHGWLPILGTIVFVVVILFSARAWLQAVFALAPPSSPPEGPAVLPTVSIVIPSFNEEAVLERTIPTALALDYPPDKLEFVYLFESACTDRTEAIIRSFSTLDSLIKVVCRPTTNGGKAAATNYALRFATGQVIGIFDADHSLAPDLVRRAVVHLQNPSVGCARGRCRIINRCQNFLTQLVALERDVVERLGIVGAFRYGGFANFGGGHGFFRRDIFEKLGFFDERVLTEDIEFSVKLHLAGYSIIADPEMQSFEEASPTLSAWFHQRKRWSRGWMQIARFHVGPILTATIPAVKKIDMLVALSSSLSPGLLIAIFPLLAMAVLGYNTSCFSASAAVSLWLFVTLTPLLQALMTQWFDSDSVREILVSIVLSPFLIPYLLILFGIGWLAFIDEFILSRDYAYVKTERAELAWQNSAKNGDFC